MLRQAEAEATERLDLHGWSRSFVNYDDVNTLEIEMEVGDGLNLRGVSASCTGQSL